MKGKKKCLKEALKGSAIFLGKSGMKLPKLAKRDLWRFLLTNLQNWRKKRFDKNHINLCASIISYQFGISVR